MPTKKVGAGAIAGALSVIIVWVLQSFDIEVPAEVASAGTVVLTAITSWFVTEG